MNSKKILNLLLLFLQLILPHTTSILPPSIHHSAPEYYYRDRDAAPSLHSCEITHHSGVDVQGVFGRPAVTKVDCSDGNIYKTSGVNIKGSMRMYAGISGVSGYIKVNNEMIERPGEQIWIQIGVRVNIEISGIVYITGAGLELVDIPSWPTTSSYSGPLVRVYKKDSAEIVHDMHINNGSAFAFDALWSSQTAIDPPSVLVFVCQDDVWVDEHFHPQGAHYIPILGEICFNSTGECIGPGESRWVSPALRYFEYFIPIDEESRVVDEWLGFECPIPAMFAVENFFPNVPGGDPNFSDIPDERLIVYSDQLRPVLYVMDDGESKVE